MPEPVSGNLPVSIVAGGRLRAGEVVSARVGEVLPDGRFRLTLDGRNLTARSHLSFQPGQIIRAVVERGKGGIRLHLVESPEPPSRLPNLPDTPKTLLSAALLRAGLPMPGEAEEARRTALLSRTRGRTNRLARLYAEILSKGADPSAGFLEAVDTLLFGSGSDGSPGRRRRGPEWRVLPRAEDLAGDLGGADSENEPLLDLLSRVPGKNGDWMFDRSAGYLGDRPVRLVWKIRGGPNPALALTVHDGSRILEFLMEGLDPPRLRVHADEPDRIDREIWKSFIGRLALMNFKVDDTIFSIDESDGFTSGQDGAIWKLGDCE